MAEFLTLAVVGLSPMAAGAGMYHLWMTRPARRRHSGMAVGQFPQELRRRSAMAVRRTGGAA